MLGFKLDLLVQACWQGWLGKAGLVGAGKLNRTSKMCRTGRINRTGLA
jgi:hypothetical protein